MEPNQPDQPDMPSAATPAPASPAAEPAGKAEITIDDFLKLDLRIATVKDCQPHPNADKLLVLQLDDGTPEGRQICAGLRGIYEPEQLTGRQIVIVANLAPRKMRGEVSQGMLLAASSPDRSEVVIVSPTAPIVTGSSVG
jgi:methionyl-tRNA synthetase